MLYSGLIRSFSSNGQVRYVLKLHQTLAFYAKNVFMTDIVGNKVENYFFLLKVVMMC